MFEQFEKQPKEPMWIGPKMLAGGAAGFLLSLGLCGAGSAWGRDGAGGVIAMCGVAMFFLSALALVVGGIVFLVEFLYSSIRGR
jgi:hypothetical protein